MWWRWKNENSTREDRSTADSSPRVVVNPDGAQQQSGTPGANTPASVAFIPTSGANTPASGASNPTTGANTSTPGAPLPTFSRLSSIPDAWRHLEKEFGLNIEGNPVFHQALTHRSARDTVDLAPHQTYERVEFLGDAILGLVTADILYHRFPDEAEGFLTKLRSKLVKKDTLADLAVRIGLDEAMQLGERSHGLGIESSRSVLSDIFESFIGAIYLTHGFQKTFSVLSGILNDHLSLDLLSRQTDNFKSMLLEYCQERKIQSPSYRLVSEEGPGHDKTFLIEVAIEGTVLGSGSGKSKKQAEQQAAMMALKALKVSG